MHHVADDELARIRVGVGQRHLQLPIERLLAERDRVGRLARDLPSQRIDGFVQPVGFDDLVDEPDAQRERGVDQPSGGEHLHRMLAMHHPAQGHHRRQAPEPDVHAGGGEPRIARGHGEIGTGHELAPGGRGDPFDAGHDHLRLLVERLHHSRAALGDLVEELRVGRVRELLQVVPGTEDLAADAAEHDDRDSGFVPKRLQMRVQGVDRRQRQAVPLRRAVQREVGDSPAILAGDQCGCIHALSPRELVVSCARNSGGARGALSRASACDAGNA